METFLQTFKAGSAAIVDIDDWVERWHVKMADVWLEATSSTPTLSEYLGFDMEDYDTYLKKSDAEFETYLRNKYSV